MKRVGPRAERRQFRLGPSFNRDVKCSIFRRHGMGKAVPVRHAYCICALDIAGNFERQIDDRNLTGGRSGRNRCSCSGWLGHSTFPFQYLCRANSRAGKRDPRVTSCFKTDLRALVAFLNLWRYRRRMMRKKWRKYQHSGDTTTNRAPHRGGADHVTVRVPCIVE